MGKIGIEIEQSTTPFPKKLGRSVKHKEKQNARICKKTVYCQQFNEVFPSPCSNILLYSHVFHEVVNFAPSLLVNS